MCPFDDDSLLHSASDSETPAEASESAPKEDSAGLPLEEASYLTEEKTAAPGPRSLRRSASETERPRRSRKKIGRGRKKMEPTEEEPLLSPEQDPEHFQKKQNWFLRFIKKFGIFIAFCFLTFCVFFVAAAGIGVTVVYSFSDPELDERFSSMDLDYTSFIYATDSTTGETYIYQQIQSTAGSRVWISAEDMPKCLKDATVAIEDKRFYRHMGVDLIRTARATIEYLFDKLTGGDGTNIGGGSTLTQQVIKNITNDKEQDWTRKVKEILRALYIERRYSKTQILEYYLNTVYFGQGANGVAAAARVYFGKDASELTVVESAAIIAITKSPTYYDPYLHPDHNKDRRNLVLWNMWDQGMITREEYDEYKETELVLKNSSDAEEDTEEDPSQVYNYYVDMVIRDVLSDLQTEKGYTEAEAKKLLYNGGLQIYAAVDPQIQKTMEDYFSNEDNYVYKGSENDVTEDGKKPEVAMIVMAPDTGNILGVIGGRGEKTSSLLTNRAVDSFRQPGSAIKPLSAYGYAFEHNLLTQGTAIDDSPVLFTKQTNGSYSTWPSNYDSTYSGLISVKKALSWSLNAPAARVVQMVGLKTSYDFMQNVLHFSNLVEDDYKNLSPLSTGALTNGATLLEMTRAYTVFAGNGTYADSRSYTKVVSYDGKTVLEKDIDRQIVFTPQTSYLITDILMAALHTGGSSDVADLDTIDTAGKSGTTSFFKDRWFIGYTPYYLGGIWWGYDIADTLENTHHVKMWHDVMAQIHELKSIKSGTFEKPDGLVNCSFCTVSGKLPGPYCSTDPRGSTVTTGLFKAGTEPTETCDRHHQLYVCPLSGQIAHENCPNAVLRTFIDYRRSEVTTVYTADSEYLCPPLSPTQILYNDSRLPVYNYLVPEGEYASLSRYNKSRYANTLCSAHTPSSSPHPYTYKEIAGNE